MAFRVGIDIREDMVDIVWLMFFLSFEDQKYPTNELYRQFGCNKKVQKLIDYHNQSNL